MDIVHYKKQMICCPNCNHAFDDDDMNLSSIDLYALAPAEDRANIKCPACDLNFWVKGSFKPEYSTAFAEEQLF